MGVGGVRGARSQRGRRLGGASPGICWSCLDSNHAGPVSEHACAVRVGGGAQGLHLKTPGPLHSCPGYGVLGPLERVFLHRLSVEEGTLPRPVLTAGQRTVLSLRLCLIPTPAPPPRIPNVITETGAGDGTADPQAGPQRKCFRGSRFTLCEPHK